jgi:hypothetical protein
MTTPLAATVVAISSSPSAVFALSIGRLICCYQGRVTNINRCSKTGKCESLTCQLPSPQVRISLLKALGARHRVYEMTRDSVYAIHGDNTQLILITAVDPNVLTIPSVKLLLSIAELVCCYQGRVTNINHCSKTGKCESLASRLPSQQAWIGLLEALSARYRVYEMTRGSVYAIHGDNTQLILVTAVDPAVSIRR